MPGANTATDEARTTSTHFPFRRTMLVVETLVGVSGLAGSIQLLAGAGDSACLRAQSFRAGELDAPSRMAISHRRSPLWFGRLARVAALALGTGGRAGGERTVGDRVAFPNSVSGFQRPAIDLRYGGHRHGGRSILVPSGGVVATRPPDGIE